MQELRKKSTAGLLFRDPSCKQCHGFPENLQAWEPLAHPQKPSGGTEPGCGITPFWTKFSWVAFAPLLGNKSHN